MTTAIILAGGLGTRLRPLTDNTPKPLLPIQQKPIMQYAIENAKKHGIDSIVLAISYHREKIEQYFGDGSRFGIPISYSIEDEPLGTGGAVKQACSNVYEPFVLLWGDNLMHINLTKMLQNHSESDCELTMALTQREDVENFGVAKIKDNKIVTFVEKPSREEAPSNLINAGGFIINPSALNILPVGKSSIETECFNILAQQQKVEYFIHDGQWFPTDTIEKYQLADKEFTSLQ